MSGLGVKQTTEPVDHQTLDAMVLDRRELLAANERQAELLRLLWERRRFLLRAATVGLFVSTLIAFLIPKSYTSTAQLMPPDSQSSSGLAMMAAMAGKAGRGSGGNYGGFTRPKELRCLVYRSLEKRNVPRSNY